MDNTTTLQRAATLDFDVDPFYNLSKTLTNDPGHQTNDGSIRHHWLGISHRFFSIQPKETGAKSGIFKPG